MSISSMTGFAVCRGEEEDFSWNWEIKSVNAKGLDIRCRLPVGFEGIDMAVREKIRSRIKRGNVNLSLTINRDCRGGSLKVNHKALDQVISMIEEIRRRLPDSQPPSAEAVLCVKGVLEQADDMLDDKSQSVIKGVILKGLDQVLFSLNEMRTKEGSRLTLVLDRQIEEIQHLCDQAEELAALQPAAIRHRLETRISDILQADPALPEDRLISEVALLMAKADVREEIDRIRSHIAATRELLGQQQAVGRKLDFLCQEFNREANTLCSKSSDMELTGIGLGLKAAIEQFREQVQNIE